MIVVKMAFVKIFLGGNRANFGGSYPPLSPTAMCLGPDLQNILQSSYNNI